MTDRRALWGRCGTLKQGFGLFDQFEDRAVVVFAQASEKPVPPAFWEGVFAMQSAD
ncbi:hypothetical protein L6R29_00390 [Myxococcota bacterium]|nr:hypothetical protein [Myxococcota bacterium]